MPQIMEQPMRRQDYWSRWGLGWGTCHLRMESTHSPWAPQLQPSHSSMKEQSWASWKFEILSVVNKPKGLQADWRIWVKDAPCFHTWCYDRPLNQKACLWETNDPRRQSGEVIILEDGHHTSNLREIICQDSRSLAMTLVRRGTLSAMVETNITEMMQSPYEVSNQGLP